METRTVARVGLEMLLIVSGF